MVGLGNPGKEYEKTRHNIGFMIIDNFKETNFSTTGWKKKFKSSMLEGNLYNKKLFLQKPLTFMNLSGEAVQPLKGFFKIPTENLLVIHDDMDIEFGKIKFKFDGNDGGHKGIKSIANLIGSKNFWRLKIGIGRPYSSNIVKDFVLSKFDNEEKKIIDVIIENSVKGIALFLEMGPEAAMNRYNNTVIPNN